MDIDLYNPCEGEDSIGKYLYNPAVTKITITRENERGIMKMVFTRIDVPKQVRPITSPVDFIKRDILSMAWGYYGHGTGHYRGSRKEIMWFPAKRYNWGGQE